MHIRKDQAGSGEHGSESSKQQPASSGGRRPQAPITASYLERASVVERAVRPCLLFAACLVLVSHAMPPAPAFDIESRVRYGETDRMGIVYHAEYLAWCE